MYQATLSGAELVRFLGRFLSYIPYLVDIKERRIISLLRREILEEKNTRVIESLLHSLHNVIFIEKTYFMNDTLYIYPHIIYNTYKN